MKHISVIVPVYNEEKSIRQCLGSLVDQSLKPIEIIVVDDGSTDTSVSIIANCQLLIANLRLLRQPHSGVSAARNRGAGAARGDILVFVDADMWFDEQYLAKLVEPILTRKAEASFCAEEYVGNMDNRWARWWAEANYLPEGQRQPSDLPEQTSTFRAIVRRTFLQLGGYKDLGYGEDTSVLGEGQLAVRAVGAKCYHANPATAGEVFESARWMGRGEWFVRKRIYHLAIFSLPMALMRGVRQKMVRFRIIYDTAIWLGIVERALWEKKWK